MQHLFPFLLGRTTGPFARDNGMGQRYGTIVDNLERNEVLELLPRRDGGEFQTWLDQHPKIEVLCRGR